MLRLNKICKDYSIANGKVEALKNVSISFRKNEFVSILGPSGCGKTTLLNIIGGLDKYTKGDLYIDSISTKEYSDRDWDTYRNKKIGFVFQSYNLIPHQTVLENVELALTIGGFSKEERIKKAKIALDRVGLSKEYHKKPNQLSGGQCQRVAIARALVNEPDILLADEPTGALDTATSIQIMELIKEISKDRLVIMVTHNPELAEKYSTRIIKLLDGEITYDSNPFIEEEKESKKENVKKSKLSWLTAFHLSSRNLYSKFRRTLLVCIAASIGIIGVATVLAVSSGVSNYVSDMQTDMLSGNPITISEEAIALSAILGNTNNKTKEEGLKKSLNDGVIDVEYYIDYLVKRSEVANSALVSNDITSDYIEFLDNMPKEYYKALVKSYGINIKNNIYTEIDLDYYGKKRMSLSSIEYLYTSMLKKTSLKDYSTYVSTLVNSFNEMPNDEEFILSQYDIISKDNSYIPKNKNEVMLVVDKDETITDLLLGSLGYYTQNEFFNICYKSTSDARYNPLLDKDSFKIEELVGKTFTYYPNDTVYNEIDKDNPYSSVTPFTYNAYEGDWNDGIELTITCVVKAKEGLNYTSLSSGIYYTEALTKEIINTAKNSKIVNYLNTNNQEGFNSTFFNGNNVGITYNFSYSFEDTLYDEVGFVGETSSLNNLIGSVTGASTSEVYTLSLRDLGGCMLPNEIKIYPIDFDNKDLVTTYLETWNSEDDIILNQKTLKASERSNITHTDNLELVINVVNNLINVVTTALVAFTALSLVVSTVMIAIITYVSVIERVKEIGVLRSLGARKKDVSRLFNIEAFIIGGTSGIIGILATYLISAIINMIVGNITGIYTIASLSIPTAIIMILVSVVLTSISGLIPAKMAADKDPVVALRTE